MAAPSEMVKEISELFGVPLATVVQQDRVLAASGHRTIGGRGRGAAQMMSADAANLIVAVAASNNVKDSAKTVVEYAALENKSDRPRIDAINRYADLGPKHSFMDALTALIEAGAKDEMPGHPGGEWDLSVILTRTWFVTAKIEWKIGRNKSWNNYEPAKSNWSGNISHLTKTSSFDHVTILSIGALIGGLQR